MRRFVSLAVLLFFTVPFGLSVVGCGHKAAAVVFCNGGDSGPVVGQVKTISLSPTLAVTGESLNYAQIGTALSASAEDCKGNPVSVSSYTYASTSSFGENLSGGAIFADINPTNGEVCGGSWNRNTGGGIANYTTCTAPSSTPTTYLAYVTATADGASSNAIPVYVHPVVTGVVLGAATPAGDCPTTANPLGNDPGTDCCTNTSTTGPPPVTTPYTPSASGCLSQGQTGQLIARVYANGGTTPADNITCQVGNLTYSPLNATNVVVTPIPQDGIVTAAQPGSAIITATVAQSSSATQAGFYSTCPPASIVLTAPGQTPVNGVIPVSLNTTQPLVATVLDTRGNPITNLDLEYNSTTPQTIPAGSGAVTPTYPGTATITAVCQPDACNPSPFNQIGLNLLSTPAEANGEPLTSNGITVTAAGSSSSVIYMGSTDSQYVVPHDFTINTQASPIKLPYVPNSMVITQDGTEIYLGSPEGIMSIATASNSLTGPNQTVTGSVLSVSPSDAYVVVTDPVRQIISLYSPSSGSAATTYGGVATSAQWSPDSNTVYITTTADTLLTYSAFTNWQPTVTAEPYTNVAVLVPSVGAYFAGGKPGTPTGLTDGRSYCSSIASTTPGNPPVEINTFAPLADEKAIVVDQIATTTNGDHLLGAHATSATSGPITFTDFDLTVPSTAQCTGTVTPGLFTSTPFTQTLAGGVTANSVTGVVPTTNSALAFITYSISGTAGGGVLPYYVVPSTGAGALQYLTIGNGATAASTPLSGVVSTDNFTFYAGTGDATTLPSPTSNSAGPTTCSGGTSDDNDLHIFSLTYPTGGGTPAVAETGILSPNLPYTMVTGTTPVTCSTGYAPVNLLVQHPKKSTD